MVIKLMLLVTHGSVKMENKLMKITCDPMCGFAVQSHKESELIDMAMTHVKNNHPDNNYSKDDVKGMIKKV